MDALSKFPTTIKMGDQAYSDASNACSGVYALIISRRAVRDDRERIMSAFTAGSAAALKVLMPRVQSRRKEALPIPLSEYERKRQASIAANQAQLQQLGLEGGGSGMLLSTWERPRNAGREATMQLIAANFGLTARPLARCLCQHSCSRSTPIPCTPV